MQDPSIGRNRLHCPFEFQQERRLLCASGIVYCNFPVTINKDRNLFYVRGVLTCNCFHGYNTEVTGVSWENFKANSTDAQIGNLNILELDHSFN